MNCENVVGVVEVDRILLNARGNNGQRITIKDASGKIYTIGEEDVLLGELPEELIQEKLNR